MNSDTTTTDGQNSPSGFILAKWPSKSEVAAIFVILLGAASSIADLLPAKYQGVLLALWVIVRFVVRSTGQKAIIIEAEELGKELKSDVAVFNSKKPLP